MIHFHFTLFIVYKSSNLQIKSPTQPGTLHSRVRFSQLITQSLLVLQILSKYYRYYVNINTMILQFYVKQIVLVMSYGEFLEFDFKWSIHYYWWIYTYIKNKYMLSTLKFLLFNFWSQWLTYIRALRNPSTNHAITEAMPSYIATYMAFA